MTLRFRRVLYLIFIAIFLVIAPLMMFYAWGLRYNFDKGRIEKTGVFYIKSYPKNAGIYLNGKLQKRQTPSQINRLLANNYSVKVEKDGYFTWQKNLPIFPQSTTFVEDITLFKNNLKPTLVLAGNFSKFKVSPDESKLALLQNDAGQAKLIHFNLIGNSQKELFTSKTPLALDTWCNGSHKLIVASGKDYLIVNVESGKTDSLYSLTNNYFSEVQCDFYNDNIFYALSQGKLYEIDLIQKKIKILTEDKILSYLPWKTKILYIANADGKYTLKELNKSEDMLVMPASTHYEFLPSAQNYIAILDHNENLAYIIDPENNQPYKKVIKNIYALRWYDKQFVYWNDFELWVDYPESNQAIFIERASNPVQNAFWHSAFTYIFGQIDNKLKIYELDSRDTRNVHDLLDLTAQTQDNIFVNKKGDKLFLLTEAESQSGLFTVVIQ